MPNASPPADLRRVALEVRGVVQGVGFRPFVYNAARQRGLAGWVRNEADAVRIEVQGRAAAVDDFLETLRLRPPPQARIDSLRVCEAEPAAAEPFTIRPSPPQGTPRPTIPADLATCAACREEIENPAERRHRYPFTNCTNCGPRWSILQSVPYDRPRTSMAGFALCPSCAAEYGDPTDRRFHAQPIACPRCGPQLQLLDAAGNSLAAGEDALDKAVAAVRDGKILALMGLGGFQLVVDAAHGAAVGRLRQRKRRPDKPFAVLFPSLDAVRSCCTVSEEEARLLESAQAPIVLVRSGAPFAERKATMCGDPFAEGMATRSGAPFAERKATMCGAAFAEGMATIDGAVAPGNPYLGAMLPYTPLHHLLMTALGRPVVCTSGNLSEEPMATGADEALDRLGNIADLFLVHDRPIVRPVDDSVAQVTAAGVQVLRRARGYAPLPIDLGADGPPILAVGGHLKNAVCLLLGGQAVVGSHIGDLDSVPSVAVFRRAIDDLVAFFQTTPAVVACDLHPDYASTRHAEALAAQWGARLVRVQHHHAHVAACMAEHRLEGLVLGLSWDGTGYGPDGTVWGGEMLVCAGAAHRRAAHLRTFPLPGGDRAIREPRRCALGLLYETLGAEACGAAAAWFSSSELATLAALLDRPRLSPRTSSMGRLFDAVAALCGLPAKISFEGQAAMALEHAADPDCRAAYPFPLGASRGDEPAVADWGPLVRGVLADRAAGVPTPIVAAKFHNALADLAVAAARRFGGPVALAGGCFQNRLLVERVRERLLEAGATVYVNHQVPPGDGGIALGQAWLAARERDAHVSGNSRQSR